MSSVVSYVFTLVSSPSFLAHIHNFLMNKTLLSSPFLSHHICLVYHICLSVCLTLSIYLLHSILFYSTDSIPSHDPILSHHPPLCVVEEASFLKPFAVAMGPF